MRIRVATLNCQRVAGVAGIPRHVVDAVVAAVEAHGPAPHILNLSGTAGLSVLDNAALMVVTKRLNELLPNGDVYCPFLTERPDSRNPPGLWVSARVVCVIAHHQLPHPAEPRPTRERFLPHTVEAVIAGSRVWLKAVQWREPGSPEGSIIQSVLDGQLAAVPAILLGDFGASLDTTDPPGAVRAEQRTNTESLERLLMTGFWDAGRLAGERADDVFDHIVVSHQTPALPVPGSYMLVRNTGDLSGVICELDFKPGFKQTASQEPESSG